MASTIKCDTIQSTTSNVFFQNSSGTEYARFNSTGVFQLANPITFPAGTAAAPSITATGDTNTGLYFPAADTIGFVEGGTEVARFDSSGNLGIGTSSPSCRLDVQNATQKTAITGTGFGVLNLKSTTATGDYAAMTFSSSAGVPGAVMAYQQTASGGQIAFGISNNYGSGITSEAMRIDSSGNLLFNSGYGSVATAYGCRAWVNFNGTGVVAIRASGNVSSITDNGTGDYTVNFTTAMSDANYSATITSGYHTVTWGLIYFNAAFTTSACRFITTSPPESDVDNQIVCATFIR